MGGAPSDKDVELANNQLKNRIFFLFWHFASGCWRVTR
ncbi:hypothetical protein COLO4_00067 [Corchorus olitorius]|uniref:Uncharacterized protein n=1 Tax=Corchorus olitorius TaxID=93759 RepID=A0A1R3L4P3_9ROSI|nr:hypothetical protein COLO4_00067 [Corchorus olitorius]